MAQAQTQEFGRMTVDSHSISRGPAATVTSRPVSTAATATAEASLVARGVGAVGLAAIALIHLLDAPGKLSETPYMFWLYLALIAGCVSGAALLLRGTARLGWLAMIALSLSPLGGFVLDRTTGLPGATGDIGNWTEPLGLASLFVEACVIAVGVYGLRLHQREATS